MISPIVIYQSSVVNKKLFKNIIDSTNGRYAIPSEYQFRQTHTFGGLLRNISIRTLVKNNRQLEYLSSAPHHQTTKIYWILLLVVFLEDFRTTMRPQSSQHNRQASHCPLFCWCADPLGYILGFQDAQKNLEKMELIKTTTEQHNKMLFARHVGYMGC